MSQYFQKILSEMEAILGISFNVDSNHTLRFYFKDNLQVAIALQDDQKTLTVDAILADHNHVYANAPEKLASLLLQFNFLYRGQQRPYAALNTESQIVLTQSMALVQLDGRAVVHLIEQMVLDSKQLTALLEAIASQQPDQVGEVLSNISPLSPSLIKI